MTEFSDLLGKVLTNVEIIKSNAAGGNYRPDKVILTCADGSKYSMSHSQDCCEVVELIDVVGELEDLFGEPILLAEAVTNKNDPPEVDYVDDSYLWTFYKLVTNRGYVTLRWFGSSNGYYSEDVDFYQVT